jgi:hypothetical protein
MFRCACLLLALLLTTQAPRAADSPALRDVDRIRLREAFRVAETVGDRLWPRWSRAPFAVLLVGRDHEFLMRHPVPTKDFTRLGRDSTLGVDVFARPRTFSTSLAAAFPAVGGVSTIVIGQRERTDIRTSTGWVLATLHEHFHQWQESQPGYYEDAHALGLARGDTTGMWMINFPFPYGDRKVGRLVAELSQALADALESPGGGRFDQAFTRLATARSAVERSLSRDDRTYMSFQLWKEGVARYTEYRMAALAAAHYTTTREFRALDDAPAFSEEADRLRELIVRELRDIDLARRKRAAFYSIGAAEALILDRVSPDWKESYLASRFLLRLQPRPHDRRGRAEALRYDPARPTRTASAHPLPTSNFLERYPGADLHRRRHRAVPERRQQQEVRQAAVT